MTTQPPHYESCTAAYPEKVAGEAPQQAQHIDLGDGEWVDVCVDCGATLASFFKEAE